MARFDWTARDRSGRNVSGTLEAPTKEVAVTQLQAQTLVVMTIEPAGGGRSGPVDFAARLEAHSTGAQTVDYTARLQPAARAPRARPFAALAAALVFGGIAVAIVRIAGWPPPVAAGIVAAIFLLLSIATLALLAVSLLMPARMAAAVDTLKQQAEESRRQ